MLDVGADAPDFTLKDQHGRPVTLSARLRVDDVLLVFFPLAFTGICARELADIRDHLGDDPRVLTVSVGPPPTHKVWANQQGLTMPILSDFWPHGAVAQAYGVFDEATGVANRGTFAVHRTGVITFAQMKGPGELREPSVWAAALASLTARQDFPSHPPAV
ncbi:putative peroxiredoxin [Mycolicibacterium madagascariense]|uniref:Alkyl hydroperoxide reductase E n=1 Tax=Mycolicibacterium madagascariense TaxID=212765 RepID=A0A7I7XJ39_9MYCO|nr:redoxin domain-containing protein [Mycolicibacterium madagascariense]MCV7015991.1 redoxin domain-containing protein [Mycolicibacterium madagascariense]BBZ29211.1 putative peroxiredoxin [Mycolicibacterium madagascariense]